MSSGSCFAVVADGFPTIPFTMVSMIMLLIIVCGRLLEAAALSCFLSTFVDLAKTFRSLLFADPNTAALAISRCAGGAGASGAVGAAPGRGFDSLSSMVSWRCCSPRLGGCDVLGDGGCVLFTSLASCSGRALLARHSGLGLAWRGLRVATLGRLLREICCGQCRRVSPQFADVVLEFVQLRLQIPQSGKLGLRSD